MEPFELHTERCILRAPTAWDAKEVKKAIDSSLDHLRVRMEWAHNEPELLEEKEQRLTRMHQDFIDDIGYVFSIFEKDNITVIWWSGLHKRWPEWTLEIWYRIRESHIWKWFATEVAEKLTEVAFETFSVSTVYIKCKKANIRSSNIPRKLWYILEKTVDIEWIEKEIWSMSS